MNYLFLLFAIIFEIAGTTLLKMTHGFSVLLPSVGTVVAYLFSFYFLSLTLKTIEIGIAYAIWCAVGMSLIAIVGIIFFQESANPIKIVSLLFIIVGVVGLCLNNIKGTF